jgi:hypothetical protein
MRPFLPLLILAGCAEGALDLLDEPGLTTWDLPSTGQAAAPPDFTLEADNFVAGAITVLRVSGAPPNTLLRIAHSPTGLGDGPCPPSLHGACLGLLGPIRVSTLLIATDADGDARIALRLPARRGGSYVALQVAWNDGSAALVSNPVARWIGDLGTALNPTADDDGDGVTIADGDCADFNTSTAPGAEDLVGDGLDLNCDNSDGVDADGDGAASLASGGTDCDDGDDQVQTGSCLDPLALDCGGGTPLGGGAVGCVFSTPGTFTVDATGLPTNLRLYMWGAGGASGGGTFSGCNSHHDGSGYSAPGGSGGLVSGVFEGVAHGESFSVHIGAGGGLGVVNPAAAPGGGAAGNVYTGGGGAYSSVQRGAGALLVAGGGGGGAHSAGGSAGMDGAGAFGAGTNFATGGAAGTESGGGARGVVMESTPPGIDGNPGAASQGAGSQAPTSYPGGAGGGGVFGGGSGGHAWGCGAAGGGGGASTTAGLTTFTASALAGVTPPVPVGAAAHYVAGAAAGGTVAGGKTGGNGLVVLIAEP